MKELRIQEQGLESYTDSYMRKGQKMECYYNGYEGLGLWKELEQRTNLKYEMEIMRIIIDMAAQKLDRISNSFPTYTLHSPKHSENVMCLMEKLLRDKVQELSDAELIMLILAAYMHDVGMYYNEDEIGDIELSDEFIQFLDRNPTEYLKYKNMPDLLHEVISIYCRCYHAQRVWNFVFDVKLNHIKLQLRNLDILDKAAAVCESHNDNVRSIAGNNVLNTRLGYSADMKFCAILLRLADYLDFDGSRTPEYMYSFLGIENKDQTCIDNWKRHLNSGGFCFDVEEGILGYYAEVDDPSVEYIIRNLLDEIEKELRECRDILQICSDRWRNFQLPYGVDRGQIISHGYDYGEYTFTLKKDKILNLFMGEQLYNDRFVFICEIMQNAIDTSSYRRFWEETRGANHFSVPPIEIYDWVDEYSEHYVRINDYGMGMDKKIIENYFLKVGMSYYNSDDFYAEKLKIENGSIKKTSFQPISQFGIGFLSCFLVCDNIEIYTCRRPIDNRSSDIIRLSIKGVEDFYTMRLNNWATGMLNKPGYSERQENYGTSILFHLNPMLYDVNFNLEELVKKYVFCPPIPVIVNKKKLEYMNDEFIYNKLQEKETQTEITEEANSECIEGLKKWLHRKSLPKLYLRKIPCDITETSLSPNLMGQGIFFYVVPETPLLIDDKLYERTYNFNIQNGNLVVNLWQSVNKKNFHNLEKRLSSLLNDLLTILNQLTKHNYDIKEHYFEKVMKNRQKLEELWENLVLQEFSEDLDVIGDFFADMKEKLRSTFKKLRGKGENRDCQKLLRESISYTEKLLNGLQKIEEQAVNNGTYSFAIKLDDKYAMQIIPPKYGHMLSYNGIIIPHSQTANKYYKYNNKKYFEFGFMKCIFVLRNNLRPQLNLARSHAYKMEWNVYTNINITVQKFFHSLHIYETNKPFTTLASHLSYKEILDDPYIKNEWKEYKIIQTKNGLNSFYDICNTLNRNQHVTLRQIYRLYNTEKVDFFTMCSYALIQMDYDIQMVINNNRKYYEGICNVKFLEKNVNRYNESFYPPLFFADFADENNSHILCLFNSPLNRVHPFSQWLLSVTQDLYRNYREIFDAIIKCFFELNFQNSKVIAGRLNSLMNQLERIAPMMKSYGKKIGYDVVCLY